VEPEEALRYPLNSFTRTLVSHYLDHDVRRRYSGGTRIQAPEPLLRADSRRTP
jgi:hypothetical protein